MVENAPGVRIIDGEEVMGEVVPHPYCRCRDTSGAVVEAGTFDTSVIHPVALVRPQLSHLTISGDHWPGVWLSMSSYDPTFTVSLVSNAEGVCMRPPTLRYHVTGCGSWIGAGW